MKYTIIINQLAISKFEAEAEKIKIDIIDAAIIDYIFGWINAKKADRIMINNEEFTRINYRHLMIEMPILNIRSKDSISRRINKLKAVGLLSTFQARDNTLYVSTSQKCYELFYTPPVRENGQGIRENGQPLSARADSTNIVLDKPNTNLSQEKLYEEVQKLFPHHRLPKKLPVVNLDYFLFLYEEKKVLLEKIGNPCAYIKSLLVEDNYLHYAERQARREEKARAEEERRKKERDKYEALKNEEREIPPESKKFLERFLGRVGV